MFNARDRLASTTAFAGECPYSKTKMTSANPAQKDIVDTAVGAGSFGTRVAAVKAAGLVEMLKGDGPFAVFAPTDEAFAELPAGTVESLLKPENKAKLVAILTYHVVPGRVTSADVVKLSSAKTAQGSSIDIAVKDDKVKIDGATVVKADITCSLANSDLDAGKEGLAVGQIENLPGGKLLVSVHQSYLVGQSALSQRVAKRCANSSCADDHDFARLRKRLLLHSILLGKVVLFAVSHFHNLDPLEPTTTRPASVIKLLPPTRPPPGQASCESRHKMGHFPCVCTCTAMPVLTCRR